MDVADLIGVHEAGIAHHVAPIREIHREDRSPAELNGRRPMVVEVVLRHAEVAARIELLHSPKEASVDGHQILEVTVPGAVLLHVDLVVLLHDTGLDFARLSLDQDLPVLPPLKNRGPDLQDALWTERIGFPRKTQRGKASLPALEQRRRSPPGLDAAVGHQPVRHLEGVPGGVGQMVSDRSHRPARCADKGARRSVGRPDKGLRWLLGDHRPRGFAGRALFPFFRLLEYRGLSHDHSFSSPPTGGSSQSTTADLKSLPQEPTVRERGARRSNRALPITALLFRAGPPSNRRLPPPRLPRRGGGKGRARAPPSPSPRGPPAGW